MMKKQERKDQGTWQYIKFCVFIFVYVYNNYSEMSVLGKHVDPPKLVISTHNVHYTVNGS